MLRRMPVDLQRSAPKTPSAHPSEARKAAEAEFLHGSHDLASDAAARVVVKRKKTLVPDGGGAAQDGLERPEEEARTPRVFRVELDAGPPDVAQTAPDAGRAAAEREAPSDGVAGSTRRRRSAKHGEVTITRPSPPDFGEMRRRALAELDAIRAEIRTLELQAEALRKAEVTEAVRWIRKEIAKYGLEAGDLGL